MMPLSAVSSLLSNGQSQIHRDGYRANALVCLFWSHHVCLTAGDTADGQNTPEDLSADEIGRKIASQWTSDPDAAGDSVAHDPQEEGRKAAEAARNALKKVGAALCSPDAQCYIARVP